MRIFGEASDVDRRMRSVLTSRMHRMRGTVQKTMRHVLVSCPNRASRLPFRNHRSQPRGAQNARRIAE